MSYKNQLQGYDIIFSKFAQKVMSKLDRDVAEAIRNKLEMLVGFEHKLDTKKLKDYEPPLYRLRVGNYRVIYRIWHDKVVIYIVYIDVRKDVYHNLERLLK